MSIVAECPHCESRFHLQPDLLGKAMRCPNPACREPFVVAEAKPKGKKTTGSPPKPDQKSGKVGEVVPVVEAEAVSPPPPASKPRPKPIQATGPAPDLPPIFEEPEEAEVIEPEEPESPAGPKKGPPAAPKVVTAQAVEPRQPAREVVWSAGADVPLPPGAIKAEAEKPRFEEVADDSEEEEIFVRKRKKKKNLAPVILIGMLTFLVILGGGIYFYVMRATKNAEADMAQEAEKLFKDSDWAKADKAHDDLANQFPNSPNATKYRFISDLCKMKVAVYSVTSQDNPKLAMDKLAAFAESNKGSPFLKPDQYAHDIYAAGIKILEDVKKKAEDHVKAFEADKRTKVGELDKAEAMLAIGREFIPSLRSFRTKDDKSLDDLREKLDDSIKAQLAKERKRLDDLAKGRELVKVPTDPSIQTAKEQFAQAGLTDDEEAKEIIRNAEADFLKAVRFEREPANPQAPPTSTASSLLFVTPVGPTKAAVHGRDEVPSIFLAVARGVLYALDEDTGKLLWAVRVGPDVHDVPAIARAALPEGPTDMALVASNVAGRPAITAYVLRTGQPRWSQPLLPKAAAGQDAAALPPAPAAGPAAVIGSRAYVPIRDATGSVLVFDIATGVKVGRITIGQAIGPGAIARPGATHLYIAAESRRIYVFDVDAVSVGGDAQCLRVIPTDHPTGTLRTLPIILGQPGDDPSPRFLVLSQAEGEGMKLRAFPLPSTPVASPGAPPLIEPIGKEVDLDLNGWSWFPPVSDSERLAVVTDRNQFRIFGINQPGNEDAALFPLPSPTIPEPPQGKPVRGLVVPAEEGAYWVLVGGSLLKYRLTLLPDRGLSLVPVGAGLPIGEPTQAAQLNLHRDTACFVVQSANSGVRAVAVRLFDGEPRWQRQLGLLPYSEPVRTETGLLVVDGDGGAVSIPAKSSVSAATSITAPPQWVSAPPIDDVSQPTRVVASPDGKIIFTITPTGEGAVPRWVIRRATRGKFDHKGSVISPGSLAGEPAVANGTLLLPASDGFIYRLVLGDGRAVEDKIVPGPKWLQSRVADPECFIVVLSNDTFLTSDGKRTLRRWNWPKGAGFADDNASWTLREPIGVQPLLLPAAAGKPARMIVADATGGIWLFALNRGDAPIHRWTPGVVAALPGGKVSERFGFQTDSAGRQLVAYTVNGKTLVCLDVDADQPKQVIPAKKDAGAIVVGAPQPTGDGGWLITELGGRIVILNAEGRPTLTRELGLPGAVPQTAGIPFGSGKILVPISDGSAAIIDATPEPKAKQ